MGNPQENSFEKHYMLFGVLLVATPICAINSAKQTALRVGLSGAFLVQWRRGFALAYILTVPAALMAVPVARKALEQLSSDPECCCSVRLPNRGPLTAARRRLAGCARQRRHWRSDEPWARAASVYSGGFYSPSRACTRRPTNSCPLIRMATRSAPPDACTLKEITNSSVYDSASPPSSVVRRTDAEPPSEAR